MKYLWPESGLTSDFLEVPWLSVFALSPPVWAWLKGVQKDVSTNVLGWEFHHQGSRRAGYHNSTSCPLWQLHTFKILVGGCRVTFQIRHYKAVGSCDGYYLVSVWQDLESPRDTYWVAPFSGLGSWKHKKEEAKWVSPFVAVFFWLWISVAS